MLIQLPVFFVYFPETIIMLTCFEPGIAEKQVNPGNLKVQILRKHPPSSKDIFETKMFMGNRLVSQKYIMCSKNNKFEEENRAESQNFYVFMERIRRENLTLQEYMTVIVN